MPEFVYCVAFSPLGFLMVHNTARGGWEFPGGRVERGESPRDAALREFREETGRDLDIVEAVPDRENRAMIFIGRALGDGGEIADGAVDDARYFTTPPEELAFGLEECLKLLELASRVMDREG